MPRVVIWFTECPRANRHWTDDEVLSRCLTAWHGWERHRARCESLSRSLLGGLAVAGMVVGLLLL